MKKAFAILMLFLYSLSVSGSVMQMHFCGNSISSVSFNKQGISCCCEGTKESKSSAPQKIQKEDKSCCDDVEISFKISAAHHHTEAAQHLQFIQTAIPAEIVIYHNPATETLVADKVHLSYFANAPPGGLWQAIPLYKLLHRIVYYG